MERNCGTSEFKSISLSEVARSSGRIKEEIRLTVIDGQNDRLIGSECGKTAW